MSLITQFNQPDERPPHSNKIARGAESAKPQSFTERMAQDRQRRIVKSYRFSMQGSGVREPGAVAKPTPRPVDTNEASSTISRRQLFNSGGSDVSPPARAKYNPYA